MSETRVAVAAGLFHEVDGEPCLIGSRCDTCGTVRFPVAGGCAKCTGNAMTAVDLPNRGELWSWTIQGFLPKNPPYAGRETVLEFVPFGVGYVDLPGACKVETRLTENTPERLSIGMTMKLVIIPFTTDSDGREILTFAFAPEEPS